MLQTVADKYNTGKKEIFDSMIEFLENSNE